MTSSVESSCENAKHKNESGLVINSNIITEIKTTVD